MFHASDGRLCPVGKTRRSRPWVAFASLGLAGILSAGCGDKTPPPSPPCERKCQDGVALRAVREMMKFAFNHTFQSQDVGMHNLTTDRFLLGSARVFGNASANGEQGVTDVNLTYVFTQALYVKKDNEPDQNYVIALDGTITQEGMIAVQPSATTALKMTSESVTLAGTVYDPPIDYDFAKMGCALEILQNGNSVSGKFCGNDAGFSF